MTDVIDINEAKQTKKKDAKPEITITDRVLEFTSIMKRSPFGVPKAEQRWPHHTMVEKDSKEIIYVDADGGMCRKIPTANLIADFREWVVTTAPRHIQHWKSASNKMMIDCIEHFSCDQEVQIKPQSVRVGMDNEPCWHRLKVALDQVRVPDGDPRIADFESFVSRCGDNGQVFRAWIGSLFFPTSDRSQYVWCYGQGGEGKSKIVNLLKTMMGESCTVSMASDSSNERWTHSILGKRLVVFPDTNSYGFPSSQIFKTCTGGEPVTARRLYHEFYQAQLEAKFFFASNKQPAITGDRCDTRRIIYLEIEPFAGSADPRYGERINASAPFVAVNCIGHYLEHEAMNGERAELKVADLDPVRSLVETNTMDLEALFDEFFVAQKPSDVQNLYVTCNHMAKIERMCFRAATREIRRWREFLRTKNIKKHVWKVDGKNTKCFAAVALNDNGKRVCERVDEGSMEKTADDDFDAATAIATSRDW